MNKKGNNLIIITLSIIVVCLIIFISLLFTGVIKLENIISSDNKSQNNKEESIKLDSSKEYVYDANYKYENQSTEYVREFDENTTESKVTKNNNAIPVEKTTGKEYLKELVVPYININSSDASKINSELKNVYIENAKSFDLCALDRSCSQILTYKTYSYNNILSVVVISAIQSTSPWLFDYKTYNIDLKTGNLLDFSTFLEKANYEHDTFLVNIKNSVKNKMDELYGSNSSNSNCFSKASYDKAYELLDTSFDNNSMYFIDNDGNINVLAIPYSECGQNSPYEYYLFVQKK